MSVLRGGPTLRDTEEDLVFSEDADVEVPAHLAGCGWVPAGECKASAGADVVRVRAATSSEKTASRDRWSRGGEASKNAFLVSRCLLRHNRATAKKSPDALGAFVAALEQQNPVALDLLARRIEDLTMGVDPAEGYAFARRVLGYPERDDAGEVGPDEGSGPKSG